MSRCPFVHWAQTKDRISLKIDLSDVKDFSISGGDSTVVFSAEGKGAGGLQVYQFKLEHLYGEIDINNFQTLKTDSKIDVFLPKKNPEWWPRLIVQQQKPSWIKVDFDRWKTEDNDEDSEEEPRNIMKDYPGMYDRLQKEELGFRRESFKKVYLILYNLFQFVGFMYILLVIAIRYSRDGVNSMAGTYEAVGNAIKFIQLIQYLEVMHPIFGYTKGNFLVPFLQVTGRNFILFAMLEYEPRMLTKPVVFYLFVVWSLVEVFRYPYYLTQLFKFEIGLLTWIRYTIWIPLYPLGILCEGIIVLRNIPYFEETKKLSLELPNRLNWSFHMPTFLYLYLSFVILPGIIFMMSHMQKMRAKKLGSGGKRSKKFD